MTHRTARDKLMNMTTSPGGDMNDTMQADTDAGFLAYLMDHPGEFLADMIAISVAAG